MHRSSIPAIIGDLPLSDSLDSDRTSFEQATEEQFIELATQQFQNSADPNATDNFGPALTQAIRGDHIDLARELLERSPPRGKFGWRQPQGLKNLIKVDATKAWETSHMGKGETQDHNPMRVL
jgi:ankyrin repeat protein